LAQQDHKVYKAYRACKVFQVNKGMKDHQELKDQQGGHLDHKDLRDSLVLLER
jgi:hypothetical protein